MTVEIESYRSRVTRWVVAFAIVALAEGAATAWILTPPPTDEYESQAGGAFILELSDVSAAPDEEQTSVAVGKKSQEIAPVAASAQQLASAAMQQASEDPLLPVQPEVPPEERRANPPVEKPPEEVQPVATPAEARDAPAVAPVAASEAAAPENIENTPEQSDVPKGQNVGFSRNDRQAIENWQRDLVVHLNRHKKYPAKAREAQQHGVVTVTFSIDRQGRIVASRLAKSSGFEELDRATLVMLQRASPLPAPPATVPGEIIPFALPVRFRWKD